MCKTIYRVLLTQLFLRATLFMILLAGLLSACQMPWDKSPPGPGQAIYILSAQTDKPVQTIQNNLKILLILQALESSNGHSLWQTTLLTQTLAESLRRGKTTLVTDGATLFVLLAGDNNGPAQPKPEGQVFAVNTADGQVQWKKTLDGSHIQLSRATQDKLYLSVDNTIEAFDESNGQPLWHMPAQDGYVVRDFELNSTTLYTLQDTDTLANSQGLSADSTSSHLTAFSLSDGHELWHKTAQDLAGAQLGPKAIYSALQVDEQHIYAWISGANPNISTPPAIGTSVLVAFDAQSGATQWRNPSDAQQIPLTLGGLQLSLAQDVLYGLGIAADGEHNVVNAFQVQDGKQLWSWQADLPDVGLVPPDHLYDSSHGLCELHINDGSPKWCAGYDAASPVFFVQGNVYLYAYRQLDPGQGSEVMPPQLYALNEQNGHQIAYYKVLTTPLSSFLSMAVSN